MSEAATIITGENFVQKIAGELGKAVPGVAAAAKLLAEGATVPFIARYRKEATGSLDEVAITQIRDRMAQLVDLEKRRESILNSLTERKLLTDVLKQQVLQAETMTRLEDVFAPFRPKKRTRATMAKERGLEPLADFLLAHQEDAGVDALAEAAKYVKEDEDADKAVKTAEDALAGARDIIAERVSEDADTRAKVRELLRKEGTISSKILMSKENDPAAAKFKDYFEWSEPLASIPSHRLLAIRRGEKEGFLLMKISAPEEKALSILNRQFLSGNSGSCYDQVELAIVDSYKRLLSLSLETEARLESKKAADKEAVRVFADNLRELLLAAPLGQKVVLAIDPGFRTGCKIVVLDRQGKLLFDDVLYLFEGAKAQEAKTKCLKLIEHFKVEAIAIGNGTASRETEAFVKALGLPRSIVVVMVNESGASIYSASDVAREEFPDKDITVRGAVSIGRRLMDPLAELVRIDAKSIGVGQYQHDVDQNLLKGGLDDTVISCVNQVGVELNTASKQLLSYVSGLNTSIAEQIIQYRNEKGAFSSRNELLKVPRLGDKTFEQAAGFLRIREATHPLDASAVHPESYAIVEKMAKDLGCEVRDLMQNAELRKRIKLEDYKTDQVGLPTLQDIMAELAKPGLDPRQQFEVFSFEEGVEKPSDLKVGMQLPGIVTNVTAFGAFVDIGVHQDGLVHVSQLADHFVKDPNEVVKVAQQVRVTVMEVDLARNRIALSMKSNPDLTGSGRAPRSAPNTGGGGRKPERSGNRNRHDSGNSGFGGDWFSQALDKGKK